MNSIDMEFNEINMELNQLLQNEIEKELNLMNSFDMKLNQFICRLILM